MTAFPSTLGCHLDDNLTLYIFIINYMFSTIFNLILKDLELYRNLIGGGGGEKCIIPHLILSTLMN